MKVKVFFSGVFALFLLVLAGCVTVPAPVVGPVGTFHVSVNSISSADSDLKSKNYFLLSALKNVSEKDLQFKEFARYVERALSFKRYRRVDNMKNADLIIGLAYGIGSPRTEVSTRVYTSSTGYSYPVGWAWVHVPPRTEKVTTKNTTFKRYMILEAYDAKSKKSQIWKTTLKSEGTSGDLRVVLPHMIAATIFEIGSNTGKIVRKRIFQNAARVMQIMELSRVQGGDSFTGKERLGVNLKQMNREDQLFYRRQRAGVLVLNVAKNSVAKKMGIRQYDIILSVNNKIATSPQIILREIGKTKSGRKIRIAFFNWDQVKELTASGYLE